MGPKGEGLKVAITGASGLFGLGLVEIFSLRHTVFPLTRSEADITRAEEVRNVIRRLGPDVVVHPAGIPDLDQCEADPAQAFLTNVRHRDRMVQAAGALARAEGAAKDGIGGEYLVLDLKAALDHLGEITGEVGLDGIYDRIFRSFCIGK